MISTSSIIGAAHRLMPAFAEQKGGAHLGVLLSIASVIAAVVAWNTRRISNDRVDNQRRFAQVRRDVAQFKINAANLAGSVSVDLDEIRRCRQYVRELHTEGDRRLQDLFDPSQEN